jgi:carboxymethylenebutenolidase
MARALLPRYANAQMLSFTDKRITANYVTYDSPGDNSGKMRGYLVKPASDGVYPVGGYPGNDDDGKKLQRGLERDRLQMDILSSAKFLKSHELSTGKIGATGFC